MKKETKKKFNIIAKFKKLTLNYYKQTFFTLFALVIMATPFVFCWLAGEYEFFKRMLESDTLSFYGVALGIFSSFFLYIIQRKYEEEKRKYEIQPKVVLSIEAIDTEYGAYIVKITNIGSYDLSEIHFCGDFLCPILRSKQDIALNLDCQQGEEWFDFENDYMLLYISGDNGSAPKYLSVQCTDADRNIWSVDYKRYGRGNSTCYQQEDVYLI